MADQQNPFPKHTASEIDPNVHLRTQDATGPRTCPAIQYSPVRRSRKLPSAQLSGIRAQGVHGVPSRLAPLSGSPVENIGV